MKKAAVSVLIILILATIFTAFVNPDEKISLARFAPENHHYSEAESCLNCKSNNSQVMARVVGVSLDAAAETAVSLDSRGWLGGIHSKSQDHGERVTTACAWCHAPLTPGAVRDDKQGKTITKGEWQGVSCGACHPKTGEKREDLYGNIHPGKDPLQKDSYQIRDMALGVESNQLCTWCHHEYHDFKIAIKTEMLASGELRCIDCHMAGYRKEGELVERFHNMKVEANLPFSCSGEPGAGQSCHGQSGVEWMKAEIGGIKGPRKSW